MKATRNTQGNQLPCIFLHESLADPINILAAVKSTFMMIPLLNAICSNNDWKRFCCFALFPGLQHLSHISSSMLISVISCSAVI